MLNAFSIINGEKIFLQEHFKIILYLYQLKNTLKILVPLIDSWKSNEIAEENIKSITKSESNYASTFADHYSLPDVNFNSHYLIKDNISIPKK